jgi:hypothetical protein
MSKTKKPDRINVAIFDREEYEDMKSALKDLRMHVLDPSQNSFNSEMAIEKAKKVLANTRNKGNTKVVISMAELEKYRNTITILLSTTNKQNPDLIKRVDKLIQEL